MLRVFAKAMKAFRRFGRARKGAAAVEFALVAMPFFLLTYGLAEVAMIGFTQTTLDYAVADTARRIRTGEVQTQGLTSAQIEAALCTKMNQFMSLTCTNNLYLDVNRFSSFVAATNNSPIQNNQFQTTGFNFSPGAASDIVVVRAYYRWKIMTPMFENVFANVGGGERILSSTMMFRNEPY
jgi:Flp pilus assembly protein TadG